MLERLNEAAAVFGGRKWYRRNTKYLRHTYFGQSGFSPIRFVQKCHAVGGGSRLQELKGQTEVIPSMAARGDRKLGAIYCWGSSWSEQLDHKELRGALESAIGTGMIPVF